MNQVLASINQQELAQLVHLLDLAQSSENSKQVEVFQTLKAIEEQSVSYVYLAFVFASDTFPLNIRKLGGLTMNSFLKRHKNHLHFQPNQTLQIKSLLLQVTHPDLLNIKSMIISELITKNNFDYDLFTELVNNIAGNRQSMNMINIILEDLRFNNENYNIFEDRTFWKIMQLIYENVLKILSYEINQDLANNVYIASYLKCINLLTFHCPNRLYSYLSKFLEDVIKPILILSTQVTLPSKLLELCLEGLNEIVATKFTLITQQLLQIIIHYNPANSLQSQKCWSNIIIDLVQNDESGNLQPYLGVILPKAIEGLRFTSNDERNIKEEMEVEYNPYNEQKESIEEESEKQTEILQASYSGTSGYTLRKLSFQLIEKISIHYSENLWNHWASFIGERLKNQNEGIGETAISFIGIIAETCMFDMGEDLEHIVAFLLERAGSKSCTLVRATSLWTLEKLLPAIKDFSNVVASCLQLVFSGVQLHSAEGTHTTHLMLKQAAISLLDEIISGDIILPILNLQLAEQVIQTLLYGLHLFRGRALFSIFKTLSSVFESQPFQKLITEQMCNHIVAELCKKWAGSIKNDSVMCPLLECLITAYENMQNYLEKFNADFFTQLLPHLQLTDRKQLVLRTIDFLSSIITAGHKNITPLIVNKEFLQLIYSLTTAEEKEIKHFIYILISDIGKKYDISPYVERFIIVIAQTMDSKSLTSRNNALMCLTELLETYYSLTAIYYDQIMSKVIEIIKNQDLQSVYAFNFARMLGRLSLLNSQKAKEQLLLHPKLVNFAFLSLRTREISKITSDSFTGLLHVLNMFTPEELRLISADLQCVLQALICYPIRRQESAENEVTLNTFIQFTRNLRDKLGQQSWSIILHRPIFLPAAQRTLSSWTN